MAPLENLTWTGHETIPDLSRAWFKGCSIVCDSSLDKKWLGALYEILGDDDKPRKAHSLEQVAVIVDEIFNNN